MVTAPSPVLAGCDRAAHVRPTAVVIACADGNFSFKGVRWRSWGATDAAGSGTAVLNDCTPYCAAGHFHAYPATIRLSRPVGCRTGRREFSTISWRFTAKKPPSMPRADTETLPCQ